VAVRGRALEGVVRFGLPADFAESWLPAALGRFKRAHPGVRIEAVIDRNRKLLTTGSRIPRRTSSSPAHSRA
jgi:DNA-binding transcriptional LysR family regulator